MATSPTTAKDAPSGKETLPSRSYRETPEVAEAIVRLIRSLGKRIATEDPDGLESLRAIDAALAEAWRVAIDGLRRSGATDREIGAQLGISRQAVEQRWPRPTQPPEDV